MRHSACLVLLLSVCTAACRCVPAFGKGNAVSVYADETETPAPRVNGDSRQTPDVFTLIVLPDTQGYADIRHKETQKHWPGIADQRSCFFAQTDWIKKNAQKMNIVMAIHVGDITQTGHDEEWKIADRAFQTLDHDVPYIVCSGNHDMGYSPEHRKTSHSRTSHFSAYFPPSRFMGNSLYDPHFGKNKSVHFHDERKTENYYLSLSAGGMTFLIITLEFKPRDHILSWANKVVAQHPDCRTIVVTHSYLSKTAGQRAGSDPYAVTGNSGESIWEKFISRHKNIFLVLSGHAMENLLTSHGRHGNPVHQVQADYWYGDTPDIKAGSGYLRIMTFRPDKDVIEVQTYSPVLDKFLTRTKSNFSLDYVMHGETQ